MEQIFPAIAQPRRPEARHAGLFMPDIVINAVPAELRQPLDSVPDVAMPHAIDNFPFEIKDKAAMRLQGLPENGMKTDEPIRVILGPDTGVVPFAGVGTGRGSEDQVHLIDKWPQLRATVAIQDLTQGLVLSGIKQAHLPRLHPALLPQTPLSRLVFPVWLVPRFQPFCLERTRLFWRDTPY